MSGFDQGVFEFQRTQNSTGGLVITVLVLHSLVALVAASWIFRDARARGKSGCAAAVMVVVSTLGYGIDMTIIVICTWILFRPGNDVSRRKVQYQSDTFSTGRQQPQELPPDIAAAPNPDDYLRNLELGHDPLSPPDASDTL